MKTSLYILPVLAIVSLLVSWGFKATYPNTPLLFYSCLGVALGLFVLWFILDWNGIKSSFKKKNAKFRIVSSIAMALGFAVAVGVCSLSVRQRFTKSIDVSFSRINTLSEQSLKVIKLYKDQDIEVQIEGYFLNQDAEENFKQNLQKYNNAGLAYKYSSVNPQADPIKAQENDITIVDTVLLKVKDKSTKLVTYTEERLTNALLRLYNQKDKKVYFLTGHGQLPLDSEEATAYSFLNAQLKANGYLVETLSLIEKLEVPSDADLVVFLGTIYDIKKEEIEMLQKYIDKGGSFLSMVDAMVPVDNINKLIKNYGFTYNPDVFMLSPQDPRARLIGQFRIFVKDFDQFSPITSSFAKAHGGYLIWPLTRSLTEQESSSYSKTQLAKTSSEFLRINGVKTSKDLKSGLKVESGEFPVMGVGIKKIQDGAGSDSKNKDKDPKDTSSSEQDQNQNQDESKNQGKESRVVVVGSAGFVNNQSLANSNENRDMAMNIINYLLEDEDFISIRPKDEHLSTVDIGSSASRMVLNFLTFIYPLCFMAAGILIWLVRRQK